MKTELREVAVYFKNGGKNNAPFVMGTNMAAHITDAEIYEYYKAGKQFNIGCAGNDLMATVEKVEIIK